MSTFTATQLRVDALQKWEKGDLVGAADAYARAIPLVSPKDHDRAGYHQEYGSVLAELGRHDEALRELETGLALELAADGDEGSIGVAVARYFLGDQLLKMGRSSEALTALEPSLAENSSLLPPLLMVAALALEDLGRTIEAREAAAQALESARTPEQTAQLHARLSALLEKEASPSGTTSH